MWRKTTIHLAALAMLAAVVPMPFGYLAPSAGADTGAQAGDGTSSITAGASCWGIKQEFPASADGSYWVSTALLEAPMEVHCDMTTDGGGWVLIGRGRNGWTFNPDGQGFLNDVENTPDGTGAFAPVAYSGDFIDKLLGGTPIESLGDGIRLRRATSDTGAVRQEIRWHPRSFGGWSWAFEGGILLSSMEVDGSTYSDGNTRDTRSSWGGQGTGLQGVNDELRVVTRKLSSHGWQNGFAMGRNAAAGGRKHSNGSPDSYLWEFAGEGFPLGFTQVYVRPEIANSAAGFTDIPAGGFAAEALPWRLSDNAETNTWGVVGIDHTDEQTVEPWKTNALVLRIHNGVVYVGGRFTDVQNGPSGTPVSRPFLAAFDEATGNWIPSFDPVIDGRVWDIAFTDDDKMIIGGDFTNVDSVANTSGLAALDPVTGEVDTSWHVNVTRSSANGERAIVRALDVEDGWVYFGGNFTHVQGGTWNTIQLSKAGKASATDGSMESQFRPSFPGTIVDLDVSDVADRVHFGGYFDAVNGDTSLNYFATLSSVTGAAVPGMGEFQPSEGSNAKYQQAVLESGAHVFVGGAEHNLQQYSLTDRTLLESHIARQGGDFQAIAEFNGNIYASCHCGDQLYEGTNIWRNVADYDRVDQINIVGQFDPSTFAYDRQWYPDGLASVEGEGVFSIAGSGDCLWVAGDINRSGWSGNPVNDFAEGFARFCSDDSAVPSTPTSMVVERSGDDVVLSWTRGLDESPGVVQWVYRDDRVIGTTYSNTFTDVEGSAGGTYTVRAVDAAGNKSASPVPVTIAPVGSIVELVAAGSVWRYNDSGVEQAGWAAPGFNDAAWASGPAHIGWGDGDEATVVGGGANPNTVYLRHDFTVANPATFGSLDLGLVADDGAAVYINGVEVLRDNLPAGPLTVSTPAVDYVWGAGETTFDPFVVPASVLVAGSNTVAVELHQRGPADASFDLSLDGVSSSGDTNAPSPAPVLSVAGGDQSLGLSWTAASDDVGVIGYEVHLDGSLLAVVGASQLSYIVTGLADGTSYDVEVIAFDAAGNTATSGVVAGVTDADLGFVAPGSVWRYNDSGVEQAGWAAPGFNDAAWASGPAHIGWGDGDEATVVGGGSNPNTVYLRHDFTVTNPAAVGSLDLGLVADDGAAVYVNGIEVLRDNLPAGPLTAATTASDYVWGAGETTFDPFVVPASVLVAGSNTVAVELHQLGRADASFDLSLDGVSSSGDTNAPSPAPVLSVAGGAQSLGLSWTAASDDVGVAGYEVYVDGGLVGIVGAGQLSYIVTGLADGTSYDVEVIAFDAAGNTATSGVVIGTTEADLSLVDPGSTWKFLDTGVEQPGWAAPGFNDAAWASGPAHIGWGDGDEATVVGGGSNPNTVYLRHDFTVANPATFGSLDLGLVADDGAAVYINGVEVLRDNLPAGPLTATTPAVDYVWGAGETTFDQFAVPASLLVSGTNTIAVELHQRGSADASFDLSLAGVSASGDTNPPSPAPVLSVAGGAQSLGLSWTAASDDVGVIGYEVHLDGSLLAVVGASQLSYIVTGLADGTSYDVEVIAFDAAGNTATSGVVAGVTDADGGLIAPGAVWRYNDSGVEQAGWAAPGFNDAAWASGPAHIGWGDGDEATVVGGGANPYTVYLRHDFNVADANAVASLVVGLVADDGAAVYINGVEVLRDNLPAGPLTATTPAVDYVWGAGETTFDQFAVPASLLVSGTNTIAVELHQRGPADASFDLELNAGF